MLEKVNIWVNVKDIFLLIFKFFKWSFRAMLGTAGPLVADCKEMPWKAMEEWGRLSGWWSKWSNAFQPKGGTAQLGTQRVWSRTGQSWCILAWALYHLTATGSCLAYLHTLLGLLQQMPLLWDLLPGWVLNLIFHPFF